MRLGLDIGTNSIGWWLYRAQNNHIVAVIDGGVRIFSDGRVAKTGASLAVARRAARAARRRRDRYLRRRTVLMQRLAAAGLMPAEPVAARKLEQLDPYQLRAKGLDEPLPLTHLGRAIFHLNQRRGFKSNRKTDGGDNESDKIKDATKRLDWAMADAIKDEDKRTYGAFLHKRRCELPEKAAIEERTNKNGTRFDYRRTKSVRPRLTIAARDNAEKEEAGYDFYPDRRHLEDEFHRLWGAQARYHKDVLTDTLRDALFETIFYQRPLKAPKVGRCLFVDEDRLPKTHPLTQSRVRYETVNNLRITAPGRANRPLTLEQRDRVIHALNNKKHTKNLSGMNMKLKALGKVLKLAPDEGFTLESVARDAIACDPVRASLSHPDRFGPRWSTFSTDQQWQIVERLRDEADPVAMEKWLQDTCGLDDDHSRATAAAPLPEGYSRLGETATRNILEHLKVDVITYNEAVEACGWHHSDQRTGEVLQALPYYGAILDRHVIPGTQDPADDDIARYGRITNPTVHVGLNQLRRLINRIICVHGKPDQIVVELARELKQSEKQKVEIQKTIKKNTEAAIKRGNKLVDELKQPDTGANRMRLRLWQDLGPDPLKRFCPYTGTRISASMLFTGACDVDHILPYSRTLDDSFANRTVCMREANREKRNKTPHEAWGGNAARWEKITANLKNLPDIKRWRFTPDAMQKFEGERGFLDRALVDTQYLSRIARQYLDALYTEGGHVWVVPGRLTEMLRRHWGLNSLLPDHNRGTGKVKNRQDHRHHAIDAAVIAATDRALVQKIAKLTEGHVAQNREAFAASTPPPWEGFRSDVKAQLEQITVSHRADHGRIDPAARKSGRDSTTGQLHNDTAYGLTGETKNNVPLVVTRKPIDSLSPAMIAKIRDPQLKRMLEVATKDKEKKDFEAAVKAFANKDGPYHGIRRVRIIEPVEVVTISNNRGKVFKGYKPDSNQYYEIWKLPDGKYTHHVIWTFDAHKTGKTSRPHPAAKRIMRLQKNDMIALETSKFGPVIATVERFDANGGISLVGHNESNADQRYRKKIDDMYIRLGPSTLMKAGGRRIFVDEIGQIRDAGPHDRR